MINSKLVEIRTHGSIYYVSVEQITFMEYKPYSDTLEISFSGGHPIPINNGKIILDRLNSYMNSRHIDADYITVD